jgi:hypothetical protein
MLCVSAEVGYDAGAWRAGKVQVMDWDLEFGIMDVRLKKTCHKGSESQSFTKITLYCINDFVKLPVFVT